MSKTIPLGGYPERYAIIDDEDYEQVRTFNWTIMRGRYTYYARRTVKRKGLPQQTVLLHRFLTGALKGTEVHHINDDGLDCRRTNMVVGTPSYNRIHMVRRDGAAQYRGVQRADSIVPKWQARIQYDNESIYLGVYDTPELAAQAYIEKWTEITGG